TRSRIKTHIQGAVAVQPGNISAGDMIDVRKCAPKQYPAVGLHRECNDWSISSRSGVKVGIQTAIAVEPRNVALVRPGDRSEIPGNYDFIALNCDRTHQIVRP